MELSEVLRRRRMVRAYAPAAPPREVVDAVVAAMLRSPSAGHTQAVTLLVLDDALARDAFWRGTVDTETSWSRGMRTAPVLLTVWTSEAAYLDRYAEPDKGWTDRDPARWSAPYWWVDAGMAAMAGLLAAVDVGLAACFFGVPADRIDAVRRTFGVPDDQQSVGVLSLGFPAAGAVPTGSATRRPRRAVGERVHQGRWLGRS